MIHSEYLLQSFQHLLRFVTDPLTLYPSCLSNKEKEPPWDSPSSQPMHQYFIGSTNGIKGSQVEEESFFLKKRANFNMLECFLIWIWLLTQVEIRLLNGSMSDCVRIRFVWVVAPLLEQPDYDEQTAETCSSCGRDFYFFIP